MNKNTKPNIPFEQLIREQKETIFTVCYMFSKDEEEVNDLFQEILINLWKGFENFEGKSEIRTWVWRVALNTCISAERKKKRHPVMEKLSIDISLYDKKDNNSKQIKKLHERISQLGVFDRALVLLWLEDLSYEEIGQIAGLSPQNVAIKLHRIKETLKNMPNE